MGKLYLTEEEATPLILDDVDDGARPTWAIAGKVLHRNLLHIQTIANALRPAWGNPRGLVFRSAGENIFVAEFETQRDHDRVLEGSPWHVSKHAVILIEFKESMQPSELQFDKLRIWARVLNLPFNLRSDTRGKAVARQIDTNASAVQFDPVGGFLRARVTIDVRKPLRRWILIDSARRKKVDMYDLQYEQLPYFCFSCGRLGHSDLYYPTPGSRDENGNLPFGPSLRALDESKKQGSNDNSSRDTRTGAQSKATTKNSSTNKDLGEEEESPKKNKQ